VVGLTTGLVVGDVALWGQYPGPRLNSVTPAVLRAGETVLVKVAGEMLEGTELRFSSEGVRSTQGKKAGEFEVHLEAGVASGVVEAWLQGGHGISGVRRLWVGAGDVQREEGDHSVAAKAILVPVPCEVGGFTEKEAVDWYRVSLRAGQTLRARLRSGVLDSNLVGVLCLADAAGVDLPDASVRDEGELVYRAETDREVLLRVSDLVFRGGDAFPYVLQISEQPLKEMIGARFPVPAFPSEGVREWISGQTLELPSSDVWVRGIFRENAVRAAFEFEAKKGDSFGVDVYASRTGARSDTRAWVEKVGGGVVWEGDDGGLVNWEYPMVHRDATGRFEVKEDGRFRLVIDEQQPLGRREVPWRLHFGKVGVAVPLVSGVVAALPAKEIVPPQRSSNLEATVTPAFFRRGYTMAFRVAVERAAAWKGEVVVEGDRVPEGLRVEPVRLGADDSTAVVVVTAGPGAVEGVGLLSFRAVADGKSFPLGVGVPVRTVSAQELVDGPRWRLLDAVPVLVQGTDAEFRVSMELEAKELKKGEKLKGKFRVDSPKEFKGPVKVRLAGVYGLEKMPEVTVSESGEASFEVSLTDLKVPVGKHFIHAVLKPKFVPAVPLASVVEAGSSEAKAGGKAEEAKKVAEIEAVFRSSSFLVEIKP
jgi:hypothetical protein